MKIAIVTGASGNLGQAIVKKFITQEYKVIGTIIPKDLCQWISLRINLKKYWWI